MIIDLRSDTVTKPSKSMLDAMMSAPVGDDVFSEDPTINQLEEKVADMFGMEAALFCPSGTMTNQIAVRCHTQRLEEIICHELSHIYNYENGGYAFNSGVSIKLVRGERGLITPADIKACTQPEADWLPTTSLVSIENTCNKGGGSVLTFQEMKAVSDHCKQSGLLLHLDGARIFNALLELEEKPEDLKGMFDSISVCFSKGLGAPVGSALIGSKDFIKKCRKHRKVMGGGMRQAGILAAACIYALDNNIEKLRKDHEHAEKLASIVRESGVASSVLPVDSNIVIFDLDEKWTVNEFLDSLKKKNILAVQFGPKTIRLVTHMDFTEDMLNIVDESISGM